MKSRLGELFQCKDQDCGFEVLVVRDSSRPPLRGPCPVCCCGQPMELRA